MASNKKRYQKFTKESFEKILWEISPVVEFFGNFYTFNWIERGGKWTKEFDEINEHCYFVALGGDVCLKVYSSVLKKNKFSRPPGTDAIRIVVANTTDAKPIRGRFPKVYRTGNWRRNLKIRVSQTIESLGVNMACLECKSRLFLKRNSTDNTQFLGCSMFPKCDYKRNFIL